MYFSGWSIASGKPTAARLVWQSLNSFDYFPCSIFQASCSYRSPAAGRQDQQGVLNLFPVTGDSPGTKVSWTRLPGLAAVLSLSPSVAIAGPLEKPVRSASCEGEKNKWTAGLLKNCRWRT